MPEVWAGALGEERAASTAGGGTALTTTAGYITLPRWSDHISITPRNFTATTLVAKVHLNPWLVVLKTTDNFVSEGKLTDYSNNAQDDSTSTVVDLSSLDTRANGDYVLIGTHLPIRGIYGTVLATNSTASVTMSMDYWRGIWADVTLTADGMKSSTAFDQSGLAYWTVLTDQKYATIKEMIPSAPTFTGALGYLNDVSLYWFRMEVDLAVDSTTQLSSLVAANRDTSHYIELKSGQTYSRRIKHGIKGIGCIEALTAASTANLVVNTATEAGGTYR